VTCITLFHLVNSANVGTDRQTRWINLNERIIRMFTKSVAARHDH